MDSASRHERMSRAAEILSGYEHTDEDEPEDCEDLPPVTEREELQQMMELMDTWETIFDELGW